MNLSAFYKEAQQQPSNVNEQFSGSNCYDLYGRFYFVRIYYCFYVLSILVQRIEMIVNEQFQIVLIAQMYLTMEFQSTLLHTILLKRFRISTKSFKSVWSWQTKNPKPWKKRPKPQVRSARSIFFNRIKLEWKHIQCETVENAMRY